MMMETLHIDGMHCPNCVKAVKEALEAIDGISAVEVDLEKGEARFNSTGVERSQLVAAVEATGFDVR